MNTYELSDYETAQYFNLEVQTINSLLSLYNASNDSEIKDKFKTILNARLDSLIESKSKLE